MGCSEPLIPSSGLHSTHVHKHKNRRTCVHAHTHRPFKRDTSQWLEQKPLLKLYWERKCHGWQWGVAPQIPLCALIWESQKKNPGIARVPNSTNSSFLIHPANTECFLGGGTACKYVRPLECAPLPEPKLLPGEVKFYFTTMHSGPCDWSGVKAEYTSCWSILGVPQPGRMSHSCHFSFQEVLGSNWGWLADGTWAHDEPALFAGPELEGSVWSNIFFLC